MGNRVPLPNVRKLSDKFIASIIADETAGKRIHPYVFLEQLLRDIGPDGKSLIVPLSVKVMAASILIKTRAPSLTASSNSNSLEGSISLKNTPVDRVQLLTAIDSLPDPADRERAARKVAGLFARKEPLMLEGEVIEDES